MATYTITEVMARLRNLPERVAQYAVEVMKEEVPYGEGRNGHLRDTIKAEKMADGTYTVSTNKYTKGYYGIREVGASVRKGRPGLTVRDDHGFNVLKWRDYNGEWHSAHSVGPADPNDFVKRTQKRVEDAVAQKGLSF